MPLSIRFLLSFKSAFSIARSSEDKSRLIEIVEEVKESFLEKISEASKVLKSLTSKGQGRVLDGLNFPS